MAGPGLGESETLVAGPGLGESETLMAGPGLGESETLAAGPGGPPTGGAGPEVPLARGSVIGRYVILSLLGTGGMGAVYAAHDPELDRKIALKLLRAGADLDSGRRMLREARALAKLAHPNVVSVHDVGTVGGDDGDVFIAMEFVDGVTVRAWLAQRDRSLQEIVDVFMAAARGLAAAHRAGLVHRDFKPDNMMVGGDGRVRVMDFGLARAAHEHERREPRAAESSAGAPADLRLTRAGTLLGTPGYMAPEQWEDGEVDARTDQFSFCVALWEALYGERPFRGGTMVELAGAVTAGAIARPARKDRRVPAWIVRVLERGLSRAPERRFATMDALLAELARGLARRRRRPLYAGLAALALALAGGAGLRARRVAACEAEGAAIAGVWHDDARTSLLAALRASGAPFAETSYQKAVPYLDRWTAEWSQVRAQVCVEAEVEQTRTRESHARAAACLDEQREELAALLDEFTQDPAANVQRLVPAVAGLAQVGPCADRSDRARRFEPPSEPAARERASELRHAIVRARGRLAAGDCAGQDQAEATLRAAEQLGHRPLVVAARDVVADLAECNHSLARAEAELRAVYVEAEALQADEVAAEAAIQLVSTVGRDRARTAEALVWAVPAEASVRRLGEERGLFGATLAQHKATVHLDHGEHAQALAEITTALEIREELLGPNHPTVATALDVLGGVHRARGALDASLAAQTRALAIRREALGADHPEIGVSANNLGLLEQRRGNFDAAQTLFEEAVAVAEQAFGPEHPAVATALNNLGRLHHLRGDYDKAQARLERALQIREARLGGDDLDVAVTLQNLGQLRLVRGDRLGSRELLARVLAIREQKLDAAHPELVAILDSLGILDYRIGEYAEAEALHERALAIQRRTLRADHPDIASSLKNLALVRDARGAHAEGLALAREALAQAERALGPEHADVASFLNTLGLLQRRDDPAAAAATLARALAISERARGPGHPAVATSRVRLGDARLALGELDAAQADYEAALAIREGLGRETPEVAEVLVGLGRLALARGRPADALAALERCVQIREKGGSPGHQLAEARFELARALRGAPAAAGGDPARALALAEQAAAALRGEPAQAEALAAIEAWLRRPR